MQFKNIQKVIIGVLLILDMTLVGYIFYPHQKRVEIVSESPDMLSVEQDLWRTNRKIPENVDLGSYLVAFAALQNREWDVAADRYLKVLATDPENEKIAQETYMINAMLLRFDKIMPLTEQLAKTHNAILMPEYVLAMTAAKRQDWSSVHDILAKKEEHALDVFLKPLLNAWVYAAENQKEKAFTALDQMANNKEMKMYYAYHRGLLSLYFQDNSKANEAFEEMAAYPLLTMSMFPEVKAFYAVQDKWNMNNPVFAQAQILGANRPAALEIMQAGAVRKITPLRGMAEALYNVSAALGVEASVQETALLLNALSLYVQPKELLPLIWGTEILDSMKRPELSAYYYEQIQPPTQTLKFKKAMNLVQLGHKKEALRALDRLKAANPDSLVLWLALADVYADLKEWRHSVEAYNNALNSTEARSLAKDRLAEIYFSRSFVYDKLGLTALAESDLTKALELDPKNSMVLNHLGYRWLEEPANRTKGFELVKRAYEITPKDPNIMDSMAFGYYWEGDYVHAIELAEKSVDLMPQSSVANAHLGDIYAALGRKREAKFQYHKALDLTYDLTPELTKELLKKIENN